MSEVSRKEREVLLGPSGRVIHIDLSADVFEQVVLVDPDHGAFTAQKCNFVQNCTAEEIKKLKQLLRNNQITIHPYQVGDQQFGIAVLS